LMSAIGKCKNGHFLHSGLLSPPPIHLPHSHSSSGHCPIGLDGFRIGHRNSIWIWCLSHCCHSQFGIFAAICSAGPGIPGNCRIGTMPTPGGAIASPHFANHPNGKVCFLNWQWIPWNWPTIWALSPPLIPIEYPKQMNWKLVDLYHRNATLNVRKWHLILSLIYRHFAMCGN
jgi:hypothetical protein